ncbi:MAG: autotransporter domain-containing protein [Candidatus Omnitrophota bacterium]|jgi:outer membrane autotransporter protein
MKWEKYHKIILCVVLSCLATFFTAHPAQATQSYTEAITAVQNNIDNNTNFIPNDGSIISIQGSTALDNPSYGLTYNSNFGDGKSYLVTRTLTNIAYYESGSGALAYGVGDYTTYNDSSNHQAAWVTSGNDATKFIDAHVASASTFVTTMEQGLGMNNAAGGTHTAVVEYGVLPDNDHIMRPTRQPDIKAYSTTSSDYSFSNPFDPAQPSDMSADVYSHLQTYLNYWQADTLSKDSWHGMTPSAASHWFPFSELGYTYYWGHDSTELSAIQGSSEFIVLGGSVVKIIGIYSAQSYMYTKNKNGAFSTDSDAQYGNGFGGFNVTGDCDTIWAGNAFQKNASADANNPNQIILASGKTISAGQGILIWSPNYTLTNYGTISGATDKKLADAFKGGAGMSGTDNVAVLFLGDTTYGSIPGGKNKVVNYGIVSSPGTAIESDAGDTEIINSGTIFGDAYGLRFKGGTNSITNTGTIESADTAIRIEAGTTSINSTGTVSGHVTLVSEPTAGLDIGNSTLTISGSGVYSQNSQTTLRTTVNSSTDFGKITATGANASVASDSTLYVRVGGYIPDNTTFSNLISSTGVNVNVPDTITASSPIFTFSGANGTGDHLDISATRANSYKSFATNANAQAAGAVLNTLAMSGATSGDMQDVLGQFDSLGSGGEINDAFDSIIPIADGAQTAITENLLNNFVGSAILRIQDSKIEDKGQKDEDAVSQDSLCRNDIWAQAYGDYAKQGKRGLSNGYLAKLWGYIIGLDRFFMDGDLRLGLAPGFGWARVRSKDNSGRTRIASYQAQFYGQYQCKESPFSLDGILAYGYNDYDSSHNIAVGSINRTANAKYDGQQFSSYLEVGYKLVKKGFNIIPLAAIDYSHLYISGYTETGADSLNLTVKSQNYDSLKLGLGFRLNRAFESKSGIFTPELRFRYFYDIINDKQQTLAAFAGGGTSFQTTGYRPAPSSFNLGARLEFFNKKNITLLADCNTLFKNDYYEAGGSLTFKYSF